MKRLTLIILLIPFISNAQVNTALGYGYDTHGRAIATWQIGYTAAKLIEIAGEIRPSLSRNIYAHNYVGGKLGLNLINPDESGLSIIPELGYWYDLKSQDKTNLNKYYWSYGIKSIIQVSESGNGCLFVEGLYINKSAQISLGIHYKFNNSPNLY